jgi:hypothetical protein
MLASVGLQATPPDVKPATSESRQGADAARRRAEPWFRLMRVGLVVVFVLLLGRLVWLATGEMSAGIATVAILLLIAEAAF